MRPRIISVKKVLDAETVNGTATVYSDPVYIGIGMGTFAFYVKAV